MGHQSQKFEFLMTLTHAQYYKFLNIQKLNYMNIHVQVVKYLNLIII